MFIDISPYDRPVPDIPDVIELPIHSDQGPRVVVTLRVERGDEGWNDAVERYMFRKGFIKASTKRKRVVKHLMGYHDQQTHDPTKGRGRAKTALKDSPRFIASTPRFFVSQINKHLDSQYKSFVTVYSAQEYDEMGARCHVSSTGQSGYAIKSDGDIISVFSKSGSGEGKHALVSAIVNGGSKLDCFDGFLPQFYTQYGFVEYERWNWDDQYSPPGWNKERFNSPDVVLMKLKGPSTASKSEKSKIEELEKAQRDFVEDVFGGELTQQEQEEIAKIVKQV